MSVATLTAVAVLFGLAGMLWLVRSEPLQGFAVMGAFWLGGIYQWALAKRKHSGDGLSPDGDA